MGRSAKFTKRTSRKERQQVPSASGLSARGNDVDDRVQKAARDAQRKTPSASVASIATSVSPTASGRQVLERTRPSQNSSDTRSLSKSDGNSGAIRRGLKAKARRHAPAPGEARTPKDEGIDYVNVYEGKGRRWGK